MAERTGRQVQPTGGALAVGYPMKEWERGYEKRG